ncbi:hypothetical protein B7486_01690 [cyanobacterium TDX16]|nr:hypothetical protein B7486_01690 [cyanobacterium TDX16]
MKRNKVTRMTSGLPSALGALLTLVLTSAAYGQTKIMCLGASITNGYNQYASYRYPLWFRLSAAGYDVDFVGTRNTTCPSANCTCNGAPATCFYPLYDTEFDRDHEGYCGWRTDQVAAIAVSVSTSASPDVVLIHLGTNDIGQMGASGVSNSNTNLRLIIDRIRSVRPNVVILLSKLIPIGATSGYAGAAGLVVPLNDAIASIVLDKNTPQSPVFLVDQYTGFDLASMMQADDLHPNTAGEERIADVWFSALVDVLGASEACNNTFVVPPVNSLLALYTFDDGETADVSGAHNHACGECSISQTVPDGYEGNGLRLDGLAYLRGDLAINPSLKPQLTMGAWVRPYSVSAGQALISHDNGNFDRTILIDYRGGGIGWSAFAGTGGGSNGSSVVGYFPAIHNQWQFVATVYDDVAQTVLLYVDGTYTSQPGAPGSGHPRLHIGHEPFCNATGCGNGECGLAGIIDNVFFIGEALSVARLDEIRTYGYHRVPTFPVIFKQPSCVVSCDGNNTTFSTDVGGSELIQPLTFQWRWNGQNLMDGGHVTGATSPTLSLFGVAQADAGQYDCIVTNGCGSATSNAVTLAVIGSIPGDGNGDGAADGLDIAGFVNALLSSPLGSGAALCAYDLNMDAAITTNDLPPFVNVLLGS